MNRIIYATSTEVGGAMTILNDFYQEALKKEDQTLFLVSLANLKPGKYVVIKKYAWIKKSIIHRLYFYYFKLPHIIKQFRPDEIISLNNTRCPVKNIKQTIYLHQALPFSSFKPNILTDFYLFLVKYGLGIIIKNHIKKVDEIIVQSRWLKKTLVQNGIKASKITVKSPNIDTINLEIKQSNDSKLNLIYPSGYTSYKNHWLILNALKKLNSNNYRQLNVIFTLDMTKHKKMNQFINKYQLPVSFVGYLRKNELYEYYRSSTLLFMSSVESFGLPLLEAKNLEIPIVCLDKPFSKEILQDYDKVTFLADSDEALKNFLEFKLNENVKV